jgi:hypothetical protein
MQYHDLNLSQPLDALDLLTRNNRLSPKVNKILNPLGYHIERSGRYVMVQGKLECASGSIVIAVEKAFCHYLRSTTGKQAINRFDIVDFLNSL